MTLPTILSLSETISKYKYPSDEKSLCFLLKMRMVFYS